MTPLAINTQTATLTRARDGAGLRHLFVKLSTDEQREAYNYFIDSIAPDRHALVEQDYAPFLGAYRHLAAALVMDNQEELTAAIRATIDEVIDGHDIDTLCHILDHSTRKLGMEVMVYVARVHPAYRRYPNLRALFDSYVIGWGLAG